MLIQFLIMIDIENDFFNSKFKFLGEDFAKEMQKHVLVENIHAKTEIIREGQKNKYVLFVIKGSLKVYSLNDGRELIYYYVRPNDPCLMTFSTIFKDCISKIYAVSEEESEILKIPVSVMHEWLIKFPAIGKIFYQEYDRRFSDIMNVVNEAVFHKLDKRIISYIKQQIQITGNNPIKLTHKEIAANLGTSREVVSRVLKKVENEGEITQDRNGIKIITNLKVI